MFKKYFNLTTLTLLTALTLSTIAAWFAIVGLVNIFPAQATAIIIMGGAIEFGKVVATVWLRKYWARCGVSYKILLVPMVVILMMLTSMGTFGFLSAAHSEQSASSGDVAAQVAIIDEKIKTQRENVDLARKALQQLDSQVEARLSRGDSEAGAERAVQIRRQQAGERNKLQQEIAAGQAQIASLNEQRAPIAAQLRKVEAEVGPIKYIAALLYGDNPDANVLERAVRWVIILLVIVFDPLAIALVLAGNSSRRWDEEDWTEQRLLEVARAADAPDEPPVAEPVVETQATPEVESEPPVPPVEEYKKMELPAYLTKPWAWFKPGAPVVAPIVKPEPPPVIVPVIHQPPSVSEPVVAQEPPVQQEVVADAPIDTLDMSVDSTAPIITEGVTQEIPDRPTIVESVPGYVIYEGKQMSVEALRGLRPELFTIKPDIETLQTGFGTEFPRTARRGDMFVRVDALPNRAYKFDGRDWIEVNKAQTSVYMQDSEYIKYLISKIDSGEYDVDMLTDSENEQIKEYLRTQNT